MPTRPHSFQTLAVPNPGLRAAALRLHEPSKKVKGDSKPAESAVGVPVL